MNEQLMELLEYRVVLGVVVTTLDGLIVAHAGLATEDAEVLAAASSTQMDDRSYSTAVTRSGVLHVLRGDDMRLLVLAEPDAHEAALTRLMSTHLASLEESITH